MRRVPSQPGAGRDGGFAMRFRLDRNQTQSMVGLLFGGVGRRGAMILSPVDAFPAMAAGESAGVLSSTS